MNRQEFKDEYLTDAFFFVKNEDEFVMLQMIGIWFGLKNHIGGTDLIDYRPDRGIAKNLTFFQKGNFKCLTFG